MAFQDLQQFLAALEKAGELHRVSAPVDPTLEISEIVTRTVRRRGPALLFEKPTRGRMPVAINLFGTHKRMAMAPTPMPFDFKRMIYGGFTVAVKA